MKLSQQKNFLSCVIGRNAQIRAGNGAENSGLTTRKRLLKSIACFFFLLGAVIAQTAAAQQASLVTTVAGPSSAYGGDNFTYTVAIANNGPDSANGAVFSDTPPAGATNLSAACAGATGGAVCPSSFTVGSPITAVIPTLPNGGTVSLVIQGRFPISGNSSLSNVGTVIPPAGTTNPNPTAATSSVSTAMTYVADLGVTKTQVPAMYSTGVPITYTVTYTNSGPGAADGASINDNFYTGNFSQSLPFSGSSWHFVSCASTGGAVCPAFSDGASSGVGGSLWSANIPTFPSGSSITIVYTVTLTEGPNTTCYVDTNPGTLYNDANIGPPNGFTDPGPLPNFAETQLPNLPPPPACPAADLAATIQADSLIVRNGVPITYTLTYSNFGPTNVVNAGTSSFVGLSNTYSSLGLVLDHLDTVFTSCTATGGAVCPPDANFPYGTIPSLPSGGQVVIVFTVTPVLRQGVSCGPIGMPGGDIYGTVSIGVAPGTMDPEGSNNNQSIDSNPFVCADVSANKTVSPTTVARGGAVSYTVTLTNAGPQNATDIAFSDPLPSAAGFVYGSSSCSNAGGGTCGALSYNAGTNTVSGTMPLIPVGTSVTITINGTGGSVAGTYPNQACGQPGTTYFDPNNSTDCSSVNVNIANTSSPVFFTKVVTGGPSGGLPAAKTFTGTLTCGAQPVRTWSITVPAGANSLDILPITMYDGDACTVTEDAPPTAPPGYAWTGTPVITPNPIPALGPTTPVFVTVTNALTLVPVPSIAITKTAGSGAALTPGGSVTYTITVTNNGTGASNGTVVHDSFPTGIASASWTCAASSGAVCPNAASAGILTPPATLLNETIATLPIGGVVTYTVAATAAASGLPATVANSATANPPSGGICADSTTPPCSAAVTNPSAPVVSIAKASSLNAALVPGGNVTYTVTVTNSGATAANGTVVQDNFPTGIASASWACAASGGAVCPNAASAGTLTPPATLLNETIATLPAGGVVTYTITATAAASGLPATVANTATANPPGGICNDGTAPPCSATVANPSTPVIRITKTANTAAALTPGGTEIYTVTVTNAGAVAANNTVVQDALPTGIASFAWTCVSSGGAVCPNASGSGALNETVATLPVGGVVTYTITAIAATGTLPAVVANTATANPPGGVCADGTSLPCAATVTGSSAPIVRITKTASTMAVLSPGDTVVYTVAVTNAGTVAANNTVVQDALPTGIASFAWTCVGSSGAVCPNASGSGALNETVVTLPAGGVVTYTITATVATGTLPAAIVNTATANPPGGVCANGAALPCSATASNSSAPMVQIIKTVSPTGALLPGSNVAYTLTVTNTGTVAADGTEVQDSFPAGIASASWTCASSGGAVCPNVASAGTLTPPATLLDETIAALPVGGVVVYTIAATTAAGGLPSAITNTAIVTPPQDGVCGDGTEPPCTSTVSNASAPVVSITKTASPTTDVMPGDTVTYTVTVTNTGSVAAGSTVVADALPAGIASATWTCAASSGAVCPNASGSGALNETIATLPSAGVVTYTITATVAINGLPATITNSATASTPSGACDDGSTPPCEATISNDVVPLAELTVTKTVIGAPAGYSGSFQLSVSCTLAGVPVPSAIITPAATQTVSAGAGGSGQAVFGNIPQGALCQVSESVFPGAPGSYVWGVPTLTQPSMIAASGNTASVVNVLSVALDPPFVSKGGNLSGTTVAWTVLVQNTNASASQAITISDPVPGGFTYNSGSLACTGFASGTPASCDFDASTSTVNVTGTLPAGGMLTIAFNGQIASGVSSMTNIASVNYASGGAVVDSGPVTANATVRNGTLPPSGSAPIPGLSSVALMLLGALLLMMSVVGMRSRAMKE